MDDCPLVTVREGACNWCGKVLKGRQSRWCSPKCSREFTANHRWTQAKAKALTAVVRYECGHCGGSFKRAEVEVNHIVPCRGKHGVWGCHHHATNLEVLCIPCHRDVTAQQRERGWK